MKLQIKNMVCDRCITAVEKIFHNADIPFDAIQLGNVELVAIPSPSALQKLKSELEDHGFELLDDQNSQLISNIKSLIVKLINSGEIKEEFLLSNFLEENLNKDYRYFSRLFSQLEGITLEQYFIHIKIEKVKELLSYNELTLSEIAWKLGYKSVQHLSAQFKKITGMTPTAFRNLLDKPRKSLDAF